MNENKPNPILGYLAAGRKIFAGRELSDLNERIDEVLKYCEPHTDQMWAAKVVSLLLKCDFRDSKNEIKKRLQRD